MLILISQNRYWLWLSSLQSFASASQATQAQFCRQRTCCTAPEITVEVDIPHSSEEKISYQLSLFLMKPAHQLFFFKVLLLHESTRGNLCRTQLHSKLQIGKVPFATTQEPAHITECVMKAANQFVLTKASEMKK